jgi:uncharacterized membrane protein YedE/YeeE
MNPFLQALLGGALIGASATILLLLNGRVAGISGIAGNLLKTPDADTTWRILFIIGLLSGPILYRLEFEHWPTVAVDSSWPMLIAGGLLVGFGTRLGSGCTSGHGVCGLARLSWRSFAAVLTFMTAAIITVFVVRHGGTLP